MIQATRHKAPAREIGGLFLFWGDSMELKQSSPQFIKEIKGRTVTGIFCVHGNVDGGYDVSHPGAFTKTITERLPKIKHLWQHSFWEPPTAAVKALKELTSAELPQAVTDQAPDATGAVEVTREYLDTERGNEVLAGLKSGALTEMSYGYDPIKFDFEEIDGKRRRNLREVKLYEVSDVLWGMNEATLANAKSLLQLPPDMLATAIEALAVEVKEGRRNSALDLKLVNAIHQAAIDLGCDQCAGIASPDADEKSRAEAVIAHSLTHSKQAIELLELALS